MEWREPEGRGAKLELIAVVEVSRRRCQGWSFASTEGAELMTKTMRRGQQLRQRGTDQIITGVELA